MTTPKPRPLSVKLPHPPPQPAAWDDAWDDPWDAAPKDASRAPRPPYTTPGWAKVLAAVLPRLAFVVLGLLVVGMVAFGVRAQAPSATQNVASITAASAQQLVLSNGMNLIIKPDRRAPTAVQMVWLRVGSMDEVDGTSGVAHVLEHMMFKGTPTVPVGEFSKKIAALGGRDNAFTSKDFTGYFQQIPAEQLEAVMRLEADRFANNQWGDADFVKELEVVKEERRMRTDDNPRARLFEALNATVFQASPYRRPIVGWMNDLEAMVPNDARQFWRTWYTPRNATLVIAGDVDVAQVKVWAERYYGSIAARPVPARKPRIEPEQNGLRRLELKAPAEQAYVAMAFKVPGMDAQVLGQAQWDSASNDALALILLAAVLDGYDGARLDRALTQPQDHVADSAGASYDANARGPALFYLTGVPATGKTTAQLEAALRLQIQRVAQDGVSPAELKRVLNQWTAAQVYQQDSVFSQANTLGSQWVRGQPLDFDKQLLERLRSVTPAQVQAVAQRYFGDDALTVATLLPQPIDKNKKPRSALVNARH